MYRLILFAWLSPLVLQGTAICSLRVEVVRVLVQESNGRWQRAVVAEDGSARFCDLGILPVQVVVGSPGCNQVTVRDVPVGWNKARRLRVQYDDRDCNGKSIPVLACKLLLRFVDSSGNAISGVHVQMRGGNPGPLVADEFGRLLVAFAGGTTLQAEASIKEYNSLSLSHPSTRQDHVSERFVTLSRE